MMNTSKLKGWITLLGGMKGRNVDFGIFNIVFGKRVP